MSKLFRDVEGKQICPQGQRGVHRSFRRPASWASGAGRPRACARRELGLPSAALSFEPLPRRVLRSRRASSRLLLPRANSRGCGTGVDVVGLLRFNAALSSMSPEQFVDQILVKRLSAREVWVGPEFRFGKGRAGDIAVLQSLGETRGFGRQIEPVHVGGERVSSSLLRQELAEGDLDGAATGLGRRYAIDGKVVRGKQLGRQLGYPTANLRLMGKRTALTGIYATWVHGVGPAPHASVSSLGTRPTILGTEPLLEAHLFDFDGDLYGRRLRVGSWQATSGNSNLPTWSADEHDAEQARKILRQSGKY
jgi:riboflavin kinase/FMN adenylyltransferase